ncbi:MAG TPA: FxSxx-COOH system tetratricopeptide repeat protein, partial [Kutzneria sp.]|nr:FxSxx-COOH system tetratricopeptide repeat protein [Kutzneria sp.]
MGTRVAVPGHDSSAASVSAAPMQVPKQRGAGVGHNAGNAQTGDHARAVSGAVAVDSPGTVDAPPAVVVGLPQPAARVFVGRDEQLAELDRLVRSGVGVVTQTAHGLGGVGKSELALQYATWHRSTYRVVWWVPADSPEAIGTGLARLAYRLHPALQATATQAEAADWALDWLGGHGGWLLVLDNVEDLREVRPLLRRLSTGHVLLTTRRDVGWRDITDRCVRLDVLEPADAVALLTRLSGQDDPGTAGVLAGELGCMPLALQQAGAYLRQTHTPMAGYLRRLREDPAEVLSSLTAGDEAQRAVARTWSVAIDRISQQAPLAARLLAVLSCLAPDELPRDVPTPLAEPTDVDAALATLASYGMVTLTDRAVTTHRLVQAVTISQLRRRSDTATEPHEAGRRRPAAPAGWDDTLHTAIELLSAAVPPGNPQDDLIGRPRWAALSPHVTALARLCPDHIGGLDLAELLDATAVYEAVQRRAADAELLQRRALAITEAALGLDHPDTAIRLNNLAGSLWELGRAADAEPLQRRALAITEGALGPDHPDTAMMLDSLAVSLRALGRAADAEPLQRRALAITEATLGLDHPDTAIRLNNLAGSLWALGRAADAEPLQRRALTITEAALGPDHPDTAITLDSLAASLRVLGRAADAEPLQRRALAITEAMLGPDHPDTALRLENLAGSLWVLGRAAHAEP